MQTKHENNRKLRSKAWHFSPFRCHPLKTENRYRLSFLSCWWIEKIQLCQVSVCLFVCSYESETMARNNYTKASRFFRFRFRFEHLTFKPEVNMMQSKKKKDIVKLIEFVNKFLLLFLSYRSGFSWDLWITTWWPLQESIYPWQNTLIKIGAACLEDTICKRRAKSVKFKVAWIIDRTELNSKLINPENKVQYTTPGG